jgi:para-nitrobenzyl esterase
VIRVYDDADNVIETHEHKGKSRIRMKLHRLTVMSLITATVTFSALAQDGDKEKPTAEAAKTEASPLVGTSWKLTKISYGDNTTYKPDDPTKYTLTFLTEGRVAVRIDCNRGRGTWKSLEPGRLEFGPMATTRAMCPPDSLYDLVVRDLPNVRSYLFRDGHLFLSLLANGGTYEFEPFENAGNGD